MNDKEWAEASSRLTSAVEYAIDRGFEKEEILNIVNDAFPSDELHVGGGPKRPKKEK